MKYRDFWSTKRRPVAILTEYCHANKRQVATNTDGNLLHLLQDRQTLNKKNAGKRQQKHKMQPLGTPHRQHQQSPYIKD